MAPEKLKLMERWNLMFGAVFSLVAAVFFRSEVALGVTLGATLACANFYSIRKIWESLLTGDLERRRAMQMLFLVKTTVLIALVFVVIRFLPVSPVAFAVGISVFLLSIAVESARFALGGHAVQKS